MTGPSTVTIPNPALPAELDAVTRAIDALASVIGETRSRIESGEAVDLVGLDDRVRAICAAIEGLDDDSARTLTPALVALNDGLDALGATLKRAHERAIAPRPEAADAPRRAADAYGRAR